MPDNPHRPLKRQRTAQDSTFHQHVPHQHQHQQHQPPPLPQPVDHIFIADGLLNKKPAGKKAPLSCCECRRLKLKCDRNFPCASCKKRGCAEICPDGVLVSGKGTRFILANTEQLHVKIQEMSDRIRQLEDALQRTEPSSSLLASELLSVKSTMGLYSSNGGSNTITHPHAKENDSLHDNNPEEQKKSQKADSDESNEDVSMQVDQPPNLERVTTIDIASIQHDIHRLNFSFPLSTNSSSENNERNLAMREYIRSQLPSREEAERLWQQARQNALWQYNPHPSSTFFPNLLHHIYSPSSDEQPIKPITDIDPRRLALLLMILSVASIVDISPSSSSRTAEKADPKSTADFYSPPSSPALSTSQHSPALPHSPYISSSSPTPPKTTTATNPVHRAHLAAEARASHFHALGRASLCEVPIMEETNIEAVLALFYEVWFLAIWSDGKKAVGEAWGIMGLVAKLAQSIGLHRNGTKAKVIPEEVEKRRALFWELLHLDARLSLSLGRPPSLSVNHMDCPRPFYTSDESDVDGSLHHYQQWKHACYLECLVPVLDAISKPGLEYKAVMELDCHIRDFAIPACLRDKDSLRSRSLVMQRGSLSTALEAVLLQLHRSYFIRALSGPEEAFNRRHKWAPSVVAVFLSASRMIATVQDLYQREPELTARILSYWSNAFSAAVALCLLVSRAPFTCLSPAALQELERARLLFRAAKETCPRALQVVPILETMVDKANDIYNRWANGQELPTIVLRHITEDRDVIASPRSPYASTNSSVSGEDRQQSPSAYQPAEDPFLMTHPSLAQCIAEVHQIARTMFPLRKPCSCSNNRMQQQVLKEQMQMRVQVQQQHQRQMQQDQNQQAQQASSTDASRNGPIIGAGPNVNGNMDAGRGTAPPVLDVLLDCPPCPPSHEWSPPPIVLGESVSPVLPDMPPVGYGQAPGRANGADGNAINTGTKALSVGYPVYGNGTSVFVNVNGTGTYSSLNGSGMSPSPTPAPGGIGFTRASPFTDDGFTAFANTANGGVYANGKANGSAGYLTRSATPYSNTSSKFNGPMPGTSTQGNQIINGGSSDAGLYSTNMSVAVLPASAPRITLPPTSKLAVVDTINFELGAINSSSDQSFMVFY